MKAAVIIRIMAVLRMILLNTLLKERLPLKISM